VIGAVSPRRARALALLLSVAAPAAPASAQGLADVCRPLEQPVVGSWARYRLRGGTGDSSEVRLALVGRERIADREYVWQESVITTAGGDAVIQSLVPASPYDPTAIQRAIVRPPGQPAVEVPPTALARLQTGGGQGATGLDACRHGEAIAWETVTVPAGQVRALHARYVRDERTADVWLAPGVPFALTRTVVAGATPSEWLELELLAHGRGATPTIPLGKPARR
jgi:hypothetical protein